MMKIMLANLLILFSALICLNIVSGEQCNSTISCSNNANCVNGTCDCGQGFVGSLCEIGLSNCTLYQIRVVLQAYQACVQFNETHTGWIDVCNTLPLCDGLNLICSNCNFNCTGSSLCMRESVGCVAEENPAATGMHCDVISGAAIYRISLIPWILSALSISLLF